MNRKLSMCAVGQNHIASAVDLSSWQNRDGSEHGKPKYTIVRPASVLSVQFGHHLTDVFRPIRG